MKKIYDVNFRPVADAVFSISASSKKEAMEIAEKEIEQMSRSELIDRLLCAVDYEGLKITSVSYAGEDDYED